MENLNVLVAANLKRLRAERQISLDKLSELTDVSKSMLGQIERGETSPTMTTLWKIANGLKVSFTTLIQALEPSSQLVTPQDVAALGADDGRFSAVPFFGFTERRNFEIYSVNIEPGGRRDSEAHFAGTQEYLVVFSGEVEIRLDGAGHTVKAGQAFRFDASVPHDYVNASNEDANLCVVIHYPN